MNILKIFLIFISTVSAACGCGGGCPRRRCPNCPRCRNEQPKSEPAVETPTADQNPPTEQPTADQNPSTEQPASEQNPSTEQPTNKEEKDKNYTIMDKLLGRKQEPPEEYSDMD